jgi:UDP-2,3-diacylglucosamine hydrolase
MAETLFISDLHLSPQRPLLLAHFLSFLQNRAYNADALYILGDFFDVWIGDDEDTPAYEPLKQALRTLHQAGTRLYFLPGNRDFLVGQTFAAQSACTLLPDPCVIDLYHHATLLMHGDSLCRDDHAYRIFRAIMRAPILHTLLRHTPLDIRRTLSRKMRTYSQTHNRRKNPQLMEVNKHEVVRLMQHHQVTRLIHGHTHRPGIHAVTLPHSPGTRMVLGEWHPHNAVILVCTAKACCLESLIFE